MLEEMKVKVKLSSAEKKQKLQERIADQGIKWNLNPWEQKKASTKEKVVETSY